MPNWVASATDALRELVGGLKGGGFRGLAVLTGDPDAVYSVISGVEASRPLLVYWPGVGVDTARRLLRGWDFVYVGHLPERLGEEHDLVVLDAFEGLQANTLAAAAEMVKGGGVLILAGRGWESFSAPGSTGLFARRLRRSIEDMKVNRLVAAPSFTSLTRIERGPERWWSGVRDARGLPGWLTRLLCCDDQAKVAREARRLVESYEAGVLLVTGDRGRGKSAAVGLALSLLIAERLVGDVVVTAPSLHSVQTLFQWLARGLRAAGVRFRAWGPGRIYEGLKGAWFRVRFLEPWRAEPAPLVVVEEAAAVGPARVRRLAGRTRNLIAVTTVHGYEGSGRYWLRVLLSQLPSPRIVELETPVRYAPRDPLEELIYRLLLLRVPDPDELPVCKARGA